MCVSSSSSPITSYFCTLLPHFYRNELLRTEIELWGWHPCQLWTSTLQSKTMLRNVDFFSFRNCDQNNEPPKFCHLVLVTALFLSWRSCCVTGHVTRMLGMGRSRAWRLLPRQSAAGPFSRYLLRRSGKPLWAVWGRLQPDVSRFYPSSCLGEEGGGLTIKSSVKRVTFCRK